MADWNYDISQAPRGRTVKHTVKGKKGPRVVERFEPDLIIVASPSCETVTISRWIPPTDKHPGRWNMLHSQQEPLAWQPWPKHPNTQ